MSIQRTGIWAYLGLAALLFIATQVDAGNRFEGYSDHDRDGDVDVDADGGAPGELGQVEWLRDFEAATTRAGSGNKPLFLLFQEVPGCQTCVDFGEQVLSHPLLVEAIEEEFVPVAIHNNQGGADRRVLDRFGEPAWNNPVVRFVDPLGSDLIPRQDRIWQPGEVAMRMSRSLEAAGHTAPDYLVALGQELAPSKIERATLSMGCYWRGEACLGDVPGILSTRTGDLGGREVVEVRYDASLLDYEKLLNHARRKNCADGVFAHDDAQLRLARSIFEGAAQSAPGTTQSASERNQKYHLKRNRKLAALELTPAQATRLNHAVWKKQDPAGLLSPRQRAKVE